MTSAVLDAGLCLLLVSAAAVTVTSVPAPSPTPDRADAVAETLTATTAEIPYALGPVPGGESGDEGGSASNPELDRVAHGTLASLLADAAVRTVRIDGEALVDTSDAYGTAVREAVLEALPPRTRVVVSWEPTPDSHLDRRFSVGPTPPPDADVHAETVRAPSGVSPPANASTLARTAGFDGVARAVADSLVEGLFPPEEGRLALGDDAPIDTLVRHRYRRASEQYGVETAEPVTARETRAANRRLAAAMTERVEADLRTSFDSPEEAADAMALDTVEISVRTWSP